MKKIGLYQKLIEEAIPHTTLEAMLAKELDRLNGKIEQMESQLPRTLSQQMESISKLTHWK